MRRGLLSRPDEWTIESACLGKADGESDPWHEPLNYLIAKAVCAGCPVKAECARAALRDLPRYGVHGVRGGRTPDELKAIARERNLPYKREAQHGTRAKYVAGCREDCCRMANTRGESDRRKRAS
jgi:Transcription factor WhiB